MRPRDSRGRFVRVDKPDLTGDLHRGMLLRVAATCGVLAALGVALLFT